MRRLLAITLLALLPLTAQWHEAFELGGELLYWKPATCDARIAQQFYSSEHSAIETVKPTISWGFRIDLGYECECFFGLARYLWVESIDSFVIKRDSAMMLLVPPLDFDAWDSAHPDLRFNYQNADIRIGQYIHQGSCSRAFVFVNFRWADIVRRLRTIASSEMAQASYMMKSEFDGAGIGVGLGGSYRLWRGLSARGEFNVSGLIGDRKFSTWRVRDPDGETSLLNVRPLTCQIPALDFRLGITGCCTLWSLLLRVEVGFEGNYYWQALKFIDPGVGGSGVADGPVRCHGVGFAGPYLKLAAAY